MQERIVVAEGTFQFKTVGAVSAEGNICFHGNKGIVRLGWFVEKQRRTSVMKGLLLLMANPKLENCGFCWSIPYS